MQWPFGPKLMIGFGVFLAACGVGGWAAAGFTEKAKTAILSGGATGSIMIVCGLLAATRGPVLRTLGTYAGIIFPLLFAIPFIWRSTVAWQATAAGEPKLYVALLLTAMSIASLLTVVLLLRAGHARPIPPR